MTSKLQINMIDNDALKGITTSASKLALEGISNTKKITSPSTFVFKLRGIHDE